jgi:hypothetical protein
MAILLVNAPGALALGNGSIRIALNSGVGVSSAAEEYGGLMVLPAMALTIGGGVATPLVGNVWGVEDVSYFRVGRGQFTGGTTWTDPIMEPSSAITAMVSLELADREQEQLAPFVSGSLGVGRVSIGDMKVNRMSGPSITERTKPMTAPVFTMGVGLRTAPSSSKLNMSFGIRWVSILTNSGPMNTVPLTIRAAIPRIGPSERGAAARDDDAPHTRAGSLSRRACQER